jgi:hypothetical protein
VHVTIGVYGRTYFAPQGSVVFTDRLWIAMIDVEKAKDLFLQQATALHELASHELVSQRVSQRL